MSAVGAVAAVDLGATSGRVMIGRVGPDVLQLESVARFPNGPVRATDGSLHWDYAALREHVVAGLAEAARREPALLSVGIDSWAVDYGLLRDGVLLGEPFHYRDERNHAAVERVHDRVPAEDLFAANGLQHLPFNTLFQLDAEQQLDEADALLLIPDLLAFELTGRAVAERTNASTTGLLSVTSGEWDDDLIERLGLPRRLLPGLVDPGTVIGALEAGVRERVGVPLEVVAVGSHDTASAVLAVPATTPDFAYISCGTWGLVGLELEAPVVTDDARAANFTNEGGVDGTIRFLHNVMGLWLLSECVRDWERDSVAIDLASLLAAAADAPAPAVLIDPNDDSFLAPDRMPDRIAAWLAERGHPAPDSRAGLTRLILESLAAAFAEAVRTAAELSGHPVTVIHLVGGGSQNGLLCRLTADRSGLPVLAGPVEATALGNVLVQARARGLVDGDRAALRALVARTHPPIRYTPTPRDSRQD